MQNSDSLSLNSLAKLLKQELNINDKLKEYFLKLNLDIDEDIRRQLDELTISDITKKIYEVKLKDLARLLAFCDNDYMGRNDNDDESNNVSDLDDHSNNRTSTDTASIQTENSEIVNSTTLSTNVSQASYDFDNQLIQVDPIPAEGDYSIARKKLNIENPAKRRTAFLSLNNIKKSLYRSIDEDEFESLPLKAIFSKLDKTEYENYDCENSDLSISDIKTIVSIEPEKVYKIKLEDIDRLIGDENYIPELANDDESNNISNLENQLNNEIKFDTSSISRENSEIITSTTAGTNAEVVEDSSSAPKSIQTTVNQPSFNSEIVNDNGVESNNISDLDNQLKNEITIDTPPIRTENYEIINSTTTSANAEVVEDSSSTPEMVQTTLNQPSLNSEIQTPSDYFPILSQNFNNLNNNSPFIKNNENKDCFESSIDCNTSSCLKKTNSKTTNSGQNLVSNSSTDGILSKNNSVHNDNHCIQGAATLAEIDCSIDRKKSNIENSVKKRTTFLSLNNIKNSLNRSIDKNEFESLPLNAILSKLDKTEYEHEDCGISELSVSDIKDLVSIEPENIYKIKLQDLGRLLEEPNYKPEIVNDNDDESDNISDLDNQSNNEIKFDTTSIRRENSETITSNRTSTNAEVVEDPSLTPESIQTTIIQPLLNSVIATQSDPFATGFLTLNALNELTQDKIKPNESFERLNFGYLFSMLPLTDYKHEEDWIDHLSFTELKELSTFSNRDIYTMTFNDIKEAIDTPPNGSSVNKTSFSLSAISSNSLKISTNTLNLRQLKDLLEGKVKEGDFEYLKLSRLLSKLNKTIYDYQPHWLDEYSVSELLLQTNKIPPSDLNLYEEKFETLKHKLEIIVQRETNLNENST